MAPPQKKKGIFTLGDIGKSDAGASRKQSEAKPSKAKGIFTINDLHEQVAPESSKPKYVPDHDDGNLWESGSEYEDDEDDEDDEDGENSGDSELEAEESEGDESDGADAARVNAIRNDPEAYRIRERGMKRQNHILDRVKKDGQKSKNKTDEELDDIAPIPRGGYYRLIQDDEGTVVQQEDGTFKDTATGETLAVNPLETPKPEGQDLFWRRDIGVPVRVSSHTISKKEVESLSSDGSCVGDGEDGNPNEETQNDDPVADDAPAPEAQPGGSVHDNEESASHEKTQESNSAVDGASAPEGDDTGADEETQSGAPAPGDDDNGPDEETQNGTPVQDFNSAAGSLPATSTGNDGDIEMLDDENVNEQLDGEDSGSDDGDIKTEDY